MQPAETTISMPISSWCDQVIYCLPLWLPDAALTPCHVPLRSSPFKVRTRDPVRNPTFFPGFHLLDSRPRGSHMDVGPLVISFPRLADSLHAIQRLTYMVPLKRSKQSVNTNLGVRALQSNLREMHHRQLLWPPLEWL